MSLDHKYHINQGRYLNIILSLKQLLPKDIVYFIAITAVKLSTNNFILALGQEYLLPIYNKLYLLSNDFECKKLFMSLPLNEICHVYSGMYNYYNNYVIIQTHKSIYMVINYELKQLNIKNIITASVARYHNMILTTSGVLASGENNCGQLGIGEDKSARYLTPVTISNVQSVACNDHYTLFLIDGQLFGCGFFGNIRFWTPHLINLNFSIKQIDSRLYPQIVTEDAIYEITKLSLDGQHELCKITNSTFNFRNVIKIRNTHDYILVFMRESKESVLYVYNSFFNNLSLRYGLNNGNLKRVPILDIIDISDDARIILTNSKIYNFNVGKNLHLYDKDLDFYYSAKSDDYYFDIPQYRNNNQLTIMESIYNYFNQMF